MHLHKTARSSEPSPELAAESGLVTGPAPEALEAPPTGLRGGLEPTPGAPGGAAQPPIAGPLNPGGEAVAGAGAPLGPAAPGTASAAAAGRTARGVIPVAGPTASAQSEAGTRGGPAAAQQTEREAGAVQHERIQRTEAVLSQLRVHLARNGLAQATLHLSPAELGRLAIRVAVREGRVAAVVRAESPETLELLERHVPELRAALIQSGLEPDTFEFELGFGADDSSPDQRSAGRRGTHPLSANSPEAIGQEAGGRRGAQLRALTSRLDSSDQGVDTYA